MDATLVGKLSAIDFISMFSLSMRVTTPRLPEYLGAKAMTSKILKEIQNEERTREPSLDQMVDLKDPKVLRGLGKIAQAALDRNSNSEPVISDQELRDLGYTDEQIKDVQRAL